MENVHLLDNLYKVRLKALTNTKKWKVLKRLKDLPHRLIKMNLVIFNLFDTKIVLGAQERKI